MIKKLQRSWKVRACGPRYRKLAMYQTMEHEIFHMITMETRKMQKLNKKGPSDLQTKLQNLVFDEEKLKIFSESLFMLSEQCIKLSQINTTIC